MFSKNGVIFSLILGTVMVAASVMAPSVAEASTGDAQPSATTDGSVSICGARCVIAACDSGTCMVWQCNRTGCATLGHYRHKKSESSKLSVKGVPIAFNAFDGAAYPEVCSGDRCKLYEVTAHKASQIADVENVDAIIKEREAAHLAGEGARYVRTCTATRCKVYELTVTKATVIAETENLDEIVREHRTKMSSNT